MTFSVTAAGLGPFSYQWLKNGAIISGATQTAFTMDNLQAGDAAVYGVVVSNPYGSATNSASLNLVAGPPNDAFANALKLTADSQIVTGSNAHATKEPGEPNHGGNPGGSSVWWAWTATASGLATLDTTGSSFQTLLAVYTGNAVSNLTLVANDDGYGGSRTYFGSQVAFTAVAGTVYAIAVDGNNGASGNIVLNVHLPGSVVASNNLAIASGRFLANGQFQLTVTGGATGQGYALRASSDLVNWITLTSGVIADSSLQLSDPAATNHPARFYRLTAP